MNMRTHIRCSVQCTAKKVFISSRERKKKKTVHIVWKVLVLAKEKKTHYIHRIKGKMA